MLEAQTALTRVVDARLDIAPPVDNGRVAGHLVRESRGVRPALQVELFEIHPVLETKS
ncbi:MAG: hypothetical protein QM736_13955 [Vicinamibacterales bacterium]